jgi:hypothetical protein
VRARVCVCVCVCVRVCIHASVRRYEFITHSASQQQRESCSKVTYQMIIKNRSVVDKTSSGSTVTMVTDTRSEVCSYDCSEHFPCDGFECALTRRRMLIPVVCVCVRVCVHAYVRARARVCVGGGGGGGRVCVCVCVCSPT